MVEKAIKSETLARQVQRLVERNLQGAVANQVRALVSEHMKSEPAAAKRAVPKPVTSKSFAGYASGAFGGRAPKPQADPE